MIYETLDRSETSLAFKTHARARRGRGILYATAPWVLYLVTLCTTFAISSWDVSRSVLLKEIAKLGLVVAAALSAVAYFFGRRAFDYVQADGSQLQVRRTSILGVTTSLSLRYDTLAAFAIEPTLRSLGADILLVAVKRTGERIPIVEGEPHSNQIRDFVRELSRLSSLPIQKLDPATREAGFSG